MTTLAPETLTTLPVIFSLTLISNKNVLYSYVEEFAVLAAESNSNVLTRAVPILVLEIAPVEDVLIET